MGKMKILIILLVIILLLLTILYFVVGNYFYNIALNPKTSKSYVLGEIDTTVNEGKTWLSKNSEDVYITTSNNGNLTVHGYEITNPQNSNIWTIVVHGYYGQGIDMAYYAEQYYNRGYNVLIVDLRGHGKSQGEYIGMGWHDRLDIIDWTNYLISKEPNCKIILHGVSMGAATVMMTTGENLPDNIKVAVEDCGYTSIWDEFEMQLKVLFDLPSFPVLNAASAVCKMRAGYMLEEGSAVEQVKKSKTPTLFIHGNLDTFVPYEMLDVLYDSANCEKQKLVIEGASHAEAAGINPTLYWGTIDEFISKYI